MDDILVSIICNAYNHELYIRDTLESFIMQQTNFKFEVLVHDDASTDNTADIIREYEKKYPEIIKPVYQTENQYSQGIKVSYTYQIPRVQGKYIALCEGDDYWIDPFKLQKQFDILEKNPKIDMCAHGVERVDAVSKERLGVIAPSKKERVLSTDEVIFGEGGFLGTNSLFFRKEIYLSSPKFREILSVDYSLQIFGSMKNGIYYLPEIMSAYRWLVPGSWTVTVCNNATKHAEFCKRKQKMLDQLNEDTNFKYSEAIAAVRRVSDFNRLEREGKYKELLSKENYIVYKRLPLERRIKILFKMFFPFLVGLKNYIRRKYE